MKAVQAHIRNVIFPTSACTAFQESVVRHVRRCSQETETQLLAIYTLLRTFCMCR